MLVFKDDISAVVTSYTLLCFISFLLLSFLVLHGLIYIYFNYTFCSIYLLGYLWQFIIFPSEVLVNCIWHLNPYFIKKLTTTN